MNYTLDQLQALPDENAALKRQVATLQRRILLMQQESEPRRRVTGLLVFKLIGLMIGACLGPLVAGDIHLSAAVVLGAVVAAGTTLVAFIDKEWSTLTEMPSTTTTTAVQVQTPTSTTTAATTTTTTGEETTP